MTLLCIKENKLNKTPTVYTVMEPLFIWLNCVYTCIAVEVWCHWLHTRTRNLCVTLHCCTQSKL